MMFSCNSFIKNLTLPNLLLKGKALIFLKTYRNKYTRNPEKGKNRVDFKNNFGIMIKAQ